MKCLIILFVTTTVVKGYRDGRAIYESDFPPLRDTRLQPPFRERFQSFRDVPFKHYPRSFRSSYRESYADRPPLMDEPFRQKLPISGELQSYSEEYPPYLEHKAQPYFDSFRTSEYNSDEGLKTSYHGLDKRPENVLNNFGDYERFAKEKERQREMVEKNMKLFLEYEKFRQHLQLGKEKQNDSETRNLKEESRKSFEDFEQFRLKFEKERENEQRMRNEESKVFQEHEQFHQQLQDNPEYPQFEKDAKPFKEEATSFRQNDDNMYREYEKETKPFQESTYMFQEKENQKYHQFEKDMKPFKEQTFKFQENDNQKYHQFQKDMKSFMEQASKYQENDDQKYHQFEKDMKPFKEQAFEYQENENKKYHQFEKDMKPREIAAPLSQNNNQNYRQTENEMKPFMEEAVSLRQNDNPEFRQSQKDLRPFREEERQSRDQSNRQPLSFGGHSSYLNFGNHNLGFASVPSVSSYNNKNNRPPESGNFESMPTILPMKGEPVTMRSVEQRTTVTPISNAPTVAPKLESNSLADATSTVTTTMVPPISSQMITQDSVVRQNPPFVAGAGTATTTAAPIISITNPPNHFNSNLNVATGTFNPFVYDTKLNIHQSPITNSLLPEEHNKGVITFVRPLQGESVRYILPSLPVASSQTKFSLQDIPLPPPPISLSTLSRPVETMNYLPSNIPKVSFVPSDSAPSSNLVLGNGNLPLLNFGQKFSHFGHVKPFEHIGTNGFSGGIPLLGGFNGLGGGFSMQSSNPISRPMTLSVSKVGLNLPELQHTSVPSFPKIEFRQQLW